MSNTMMSVLNRRRLGFVTVLLTMLPVFALVGCAAAPHAGGNAPLYTSADQPLPKNARYNPVVKNIEGWTVYVDPALLPGGDQAELGEQALKMLANHLQRIAILMPDDKIDAMRKFEIWIEYKHPELSAMQYHPDDEWLLENGYDPRLAKKVHIPRADTLLSRAQMLKQPAMVLHELAHAYHDQVLGFDNPDVIAAYQHAMDKHLYDRVLLYTGRMVRHYATTNPMEFFAESTEAYFYRNDFYPFVRAELEQHDPLTHDLMKKVWGPLR